MILPVSVSNYIYSVQSCLVHVAGWYMEEKEKKDHQL